MKQTEFLHGRKRLITAISLGALTAAFAPARDGSIEHLLIAWNVFVWVYLLLVWVMMLRAGDEHFARLARQSDEKAAVVLTLVSIASVMSLIAIFLELARVGGLTGVERVTHLALAGSTVVGSWLLVPTAFGLHYTHLYYSPRAPGAPPPLLFPEPGCKPDYWDFMYFSITIAVAAQTADVSCASPAMRKTVLAQALLTFVFNTSILALMVNIAASLAFSG